MARKDKGGKKVKKPKQDKAKKGPSEKQGDIGSGARGGAPIRGFPLC
jgi:hypothetical protein